MKNMLEIQHILEVLYESYPDAQCELQYMSSFELLVSTILSAQATDRKVNQVTKRLFEKYKTPLDFIKLTQEKLEQEIKEIGLYHNKSRNILNMCRALIDNFDGKVPNSMEQLISLNGVGRKTANVVLSNAFHIPALAVDTHVFRVSNRIGLAASTNIMTVERQLMDCIPKNQWIIAHHTFIFHGRRICKAIHPRCDECRISEYCRYFQEKS